MLWYFHSIRGLLRWCNKHLDNLEAWHVLWPTWRDHSPDIILYPANWAKGKILKFNSEKCQIWKEIPFPAPVFWYPCWFWYLLSILRWFLKHLDLCCNRVSTKFNSLAPYLPSTQYILHWVFNDSSFFVAPPENERMFPEKGPLKKRGNESSSNLRFSGDMLVLRGVYIYIYGLYY